MTVTPVPKRLVVFEVRGNYGWTRSKKTQKRWEVNDWRIRNVIREKRREIVRSAETFMDLTEPEE